MTRQKHDRQQIVHSAAKIDGEEETDDMSVAASFAALVYTAPTTSDSNEIAISEEDNSDRGDESTIEKGGSSDAEEMVEEKEQDRDSDSDESDIDLVKERAAIEKMEAKEENCNIAAKTENEVDLYQTPLPELEKRFALSLTVEEHHKSRLSTHANLCLAGNIKSHMVQDRTIIIESSQGNGSNEPLDEGSLLVISMEGEGSTNEQLEQPSLVPVGRVFEVFGPLRRPLYTVRLPPSPNKEKSAQRKKGDGIGGPRREMEPVLEGTTCATREVKISPDSDAAVAGGEVENAISSATEDMKTISMPDAAPCLNELESRKEANEDAPCGAPSDLAALQTNQVSTEEASVNEAEIQEPGKGNAILCGMNATDHGQIAPNNSRDENAMATSDEYVTEGRSLGINNKPKEKYSELNASETKEMIETQPEQLTLQPGKGKSKAEAFKFNDQSSYHATDGKEEQGSNSATLAETDPWSLDGEYTKFLSSHLELPIYYVQDEAKIIDTESLLRKSTKGCDASNFYDEEVVSVQEMYFSDDEEERQLKSKRKNRKRDALSRRDAVTGKGNPPNREHTEGGGRGGRGRGHYQPVPIPTGFHQRHPQIRIQPCHSPYHQSACQGGIISPPPPPPPRDAHNQHHQHQPPRGHSTLQAYDYAPLHSHYALAPQHGAFLSHPPRQNQYHRSCPGQSPPPRPQNAPNEHQQQSDTVYYDYS